jgi:hypothetical protein
LAAQEKMANWAFWGFVVGAAQLGIATAGTIAIVVTLRQTGSANEIAARSLVADQRAWISTDLEITDTLTFGPNGSVTIGVNLLVSNIGKTPAQNVHTAMTLLLDLQNLPADLRAFARSHRRRNVDAGRVSLPNEVYRRPWHPSAEPGEVEKHAMGETVFLAVCGCVTYEVQHDSSLHQTAFVYWLSHHRVGQDVAKANVEFQVGAGGFAD